MVEFLLILGAVVIYFAPALVAAWVRHPRLAYISGVNAAFGVTVVGWAGALMWALRRRKVVAMSYHGDMQMPRSFNTNLAAVSALIIGVAIVATVVVNRLQFHSANQATAAVYAAGVTTPQPQWQYADAGDARVATLASLNNLTQPAPFKGGPVVLGVTRGADGAVVKLDTDAELACSYAPTATSIEVSFDGGPAQAFACANAPAGARKLLFDGDHSTAYLADPTTFLAHMKGAHHMTMTASFSGVTEPQSLEYDLPADAPALETAPAAKAPAVAVAAAALAVPAVAVAAASPASADDADDHAHGRHHKRHGRHTAAANDDDDATYVDGVPAHKAHAHHRRHHRG